MNQILYIISLPILAGIVLFLIPYKLRIWKGLLSLLVTLFTFYISILIYHSDYHILRVDNNYLSGLYSFSGIEISNDLSRYLTFQIDSLSRLIVLFIGLFSVLIALYSLVYLNKDRRIDSYFEYFLITLGASYGAVVSDNLLLFIVFWGILGITLYKLIKGKDEESSSAAKKSLILIGASDGIMILGIAIIWKMTHTLNISEISLQTHSISSVVAFFALLIGSFTKAGAFPFHTWIPDYARYAPASSSAYLPASLDKLLGIYFLARITNHLFVMNDWITLTLLIIGAVTIITAVMMALVQHNYKRLLGYHAVSQVGYMIIGFGLGSLIGIAAGLFHMVNHALYKTGLFLSSGNIEYRTGKENIDDLGGLSKVMPITFISTLIFALSISGIPPLNGFASKWMIYQGIVEFGKGTGIANQMWILWLGLAVLGSALTLASFIKFVGGIFLGRKLVKFDNLKEVPVLMWAPTIVIALLCLLFGVFATNYIVPELIMPVSGEFVFHGFWDSTFVSILILLSIVLGIFIYLAGNLKKFRTDESFVGGGEKMQELSDFSAPEFYKTFGEFNILAWIYRKADEKWFDIYDLNKRAILWSSNLFSKAHTGFLHDYAFWILIGLIIMLIVLI